jgi:hypothetical protein
MVHCDYSNGKITFTSRSGKSLDDVCAHLTDAARHIFENQEIFNPRSTYRHINSSRPYLMARDFVLDGELYNHDWTF